MVERLQIHYEATPSIFLWDDKRVSEEPFVPQSQLCCPFRYHCVDLQGQCSLLSFLHFTSHLCKGFSRGGFWLKCNMCFYTVPHTKGSQVIPTHSYTNSSKLCTELRKWENGLGSNPFCVLQSGMVLKTCISALAAHCWMQFEVGSMVLEDNFFEEWLQLEWYWKAVFYCLLAHFHLFFIFWVVVVVQKDCSFVSSGCHASFPHILQVMIVL